MGCGRFDCGPTIVDKTWLLYDLKPQPQPQLFQQHEFTTIRSRHGEIYQKAHLPRGVAFKCKCSLILWKGEKNSCTTLIYTNANKKVTPRISKSCKIKMIITTLESTTMKNLMRKAVTLLIKKSETKEDRRSNQK